MGKQRDLSRQLTPEGTSASGNGVKQQHGLSAHTHSGKVMELTNKNKLQRFLQLTECSGLASLSAVFSKDIVKSTSNRPPTTPRALLVYKNLVELGDVTDILSPFSRHGPVTASLQTHPPPEGHLPPGEQRAKQTAKEGRRF